MKTKIKIFSLFTWIGAFEYALSLLSNLIDYTIIWYSEIDKFAIETYKKHFPWVKNYGDITKIDTTQIDDIDVLMWWPPCQDYSLNGKREWIDWERWSLFFDYLRILKSKNPKFFIFENVKWLLSSNNGKDFEKVKDELDKAWYNIQYKVLNSKNFWLPQNRERVFIFGMRKDLWEFNFEIPSWNWKTSIIKDILDENFDVKYYRSEKRIKGLYKSKFMSERWEHRDKICHCLMAHWTRKWIIENRDVDFINKFNRRELNENELNGIRVRQLSPQEYEKIQGFPSWYTSWVSDSQRYKQIWNSISINVLEELLSSFFEYIESNENTINKKRIPNTKKVFDSSRVTSTNDKVLEALYVINKHTKELRDQKFELIDLIYGENRMKYSNSLDYYDLYDIHVDIRCLKNEIKQIYDIKSKTIEKLYKKWVLKLEWHHTFDDWYARDYYTSWTFSFHDNTNFSNTNLGHISWTISKEKELSTMRYNEALEILNEFLETQKLEKIIS